MKRLLLFSTLLTLLIFLIPVCTVLRAPAAPDADEAPTFAPSVPSPGSPTPSVSPTPTAAVTTDADTTVQVRLNDGSTAPMPMKEYLFCVMAGEMEPTANPEALKALAVAVRTFTLRNIEHNRAAPQTTHQGSDADVCADSGHCMAFRDRATAMADWQSYTDAQTNADKLDAAIAATDGQVLLYDNQPILAVFHAISGGQTEAAADVWGGDYPYLASVDSTVDEQAKGYASQLTVSAEDFKAKALQTWPQADLSGDPSQWVSDIRRSDAGGILDCRIGGVTVTGGQLRTLLSLRSAHIDVTVADVKLTFAVKGYGHGVGMSQAGAIALAAQGQTYQQILTHYYPGAVIGNAP